MSLSPDVTMLLVDSDLGAQPFVIRRRTGKWVGGRFEVNQTETINATGIIVPPSSEKLQYFPEGERRNGMIAIYSQTTMHLTDGKDIADDVTWHGDNYKIIQIDPWVDYGYNIAYASKR